MPLKLRKATSAGVHSVCTFQAPDGSIHEVAITQDEYDNLGLRSKDDSKAMILHGGRSIRPAANAKLIVASTKLKWDTPNGLLGVGDYADFGGMLMIQEERLDPADLAILILEVGDYTGDPAFANTLNADLVHNRRRIQIMDGVLQ